MLKWGKIFIALAVLAGVLPAFGILFGFVIFLLGGQTFEALANVVANVGLLSPVFIFATAQVYARRGVVSQASSVSNSS